MSKELLKAENERREFKKFLDALWVSFDDRQFESRCPPEPDILFTSKKLGPVAFELGRICHQQLAHLRGAATKATHFKITPNRLADPTQHILESKTSKVYESKHPIELLLYRDGDLLPPDDSVVYNLTWIAEGNAGQFRRIWYRGDQLSCVFTASRLPVF